MVSFYAYIRQNNLALCAGLGGQIKQENTVY